MRHFSVKNLEKYQHYKDRTPPWIKLYNDTLDDYEFGQLPDASKWHLVAIWLLASRSSNRIPYDPAWVARRINALEPVDLDLLARAGFIIVDQPLQAVEQNASKPQATCPPEREGETETETETEKNSVTDVTEAVASAATEPVDLKAILFNECLQWFAPRGPKNVPAARRVIGKWISAYGEGAVLQGFMAAQRNSAVDPTSYIARILNGKRLASPHKTDADAAAEAIAFFQAQEQTVAAGGAGDAGPNLPALGCNGGMEETGSEGRDRGPGANDDAALLHAGELQIDPTRAVH